MATGLCRWLSIQQDGYRLRFHRANLSSQLWIDPSFREESLAFFRRYLKAGDTVIDVGANIGDTVLVESLIVGNQGNVTGIEAHPRTFEFLTENIKINQAENVTLIHSAVGAEAGVVRFSDDRRDDMNRVGGGDLEVKVARLDDLVPRSPAIALLKVDVEGFEKFVFEGGPEVIGRTECIYFEVCATHFGWFGYTTKELLEMIAIAGFTLLRHVDTESVTRVDTAFDPPQYDNLIAVRDIKQFIDLTGYAVI